MDRGPNKISGTLEATERWVGFTTGDQVTIRGQVYEFTPSGCFVPVTMTVTSAPSGMGTHTPLSPTRQEKRRAARQEKKKAGTRK